MRYSHDEAWMVANLGFSLDEAHTVFTAVQEIRSNIINATFTINSATNVNVFSPAQSFLLPVEMVKKEALLDGDKVQKIIDFFTLLFANKNEEFKKVGEYNPAAVLPFLELEDGKLLCLHEASLFEALYDNPMFFIGQDKAYSGEGLNNRGIFCEDISFNFLSRVFHEDRIHKNVKILKGSKIVGEIDLLVNYGEHLILIEAKSKRMTFGAKAGNIALARTDFEKGVQRAYTQLTDNILLLKDGTTELQSADGTKQPKPKFRFAYPMVVMSDHYPALYMQSKLFLKEYEISKTSLSAFVGDIFILDEITEFLNTPLLFLSYLRQHAKYKHKITSNSEHAVLGYHLTQNLWFDDEFSHIVIYDDFGQDLEAAFSVRRDGLNGNDTPRGLLTVSRGAYIDSIIEQLGNVPNSAALELGFILLETSSDAMREINARLEERRQTCLSGKECCDFSVPMVGDKTGYTIHVTTSHPAEVEERLRAHCEFRKNEGNAQNWYGIALEPKNMQITITARLEHPNVVRNPLKTAQNGKYRFTPKYTKLGSKNKKIGRNEPCPCGSGKKFKKCCLN